MLQRARKSRRNLKNLIQRGQVRIHKGQVGFKTSPVLLFCIERLGRL